MFQEYAGDSCSTGVKEGAAVTVCREHCREDGCNVAAEKRAEWWGLILAAFLLWVGV